jgi:cell shape-determining protein MreC
MVYTKPQNDFFVSIARKKGAMPMPDHELKEHYKLFCDAFNLESYFFSKFSAKFYYERKKVLNIHSKRIATTSPLGNEILYSVKKMLQELKTLKTENKELKAELRKLKDIRQAVENYQKENKSSNIISQTKSA